MTPEVEQLYGNRLRVRACGLFVRDNAILMVNHRNLMPDGDFWSPPGGGVGVGESARLCVEREFREETRIDASAGDFMFGCEYIHDPLHAVELFFRMNSDDAGAIPLVGFDPELAETNQMIYEVGFLTWDRVGQLSKLNRHGIFNLVTEPSMVMHLNGYYSI